VKSPRFEYHEPTSRDEALDLLARHGPAARLLAGGQSLLPLLNFRLAHPEHLVDLNRVSEMAGVRVRDGDLVLGAMVRQRALEHSDLVGQRCALIGQALPLVGHPQIRNRGTLGGSLAHADPAAELPAVMAACEARCRVQSRRGERLVDAEEFFVGQLTTVLAADEMLVAVEVPAWPERTGSSLQEVAMRVGDFALAGVAATLTLEPAGRVARARIVCFGVGDRPLRQHAAEEALQGESPTEARFAEVGRLVTDTIDAFDDLHASAAYRRRVAGVLTERALAAALRCVAA
jgi:aerobic carbon-monoxide dehydrogenase medium subunit